ncbi:hypothetical protein DEI81_08225 [Curtobacterium sp. MCBD17_013]|uniref:MarR family transcriptional regulator n=1 Tax=Curtobacterium sp. MCBD17_013 TaxID=2175668 RepID=UPI000DA93067|nr:MarR family transcriptional regulator [Curtobacterium sp. MCBD17_013]PZF63376.1 hypothetical protein DEI81_08225 [Curtobacterium sp. MCBD17_013]
MTDTTTTATDRAPGTDAGTDAAALARVLNAYRLMQVHHARVLTRESAARGLNATDARFVFFLSVAEAGVTPKQASEYLALSTGATTNLVDRLVDRGHIERRPNPEDRRSVLLQLTPTGAETAEQIGVVYRAAFESGIPTEYLVPLARAFEQVAARLGECASADGCPDAVHAAG